MGEFKASVTDNRDFIWDMQNSSALSEIEDILSDIEQLKFRVDFCGHILGKDDLTKIEDHLLYLRRILMP